MLKHNKTKSKITLLERNPEAEFYIFAAMLPSLKDTTSSQKLILHFMVMQGGSVKMSQATLAQVLGTKQGAINRHLKGLIDLGYVTKEGHRNKVQQYFVRPDLYTELDLTKVHPISNDLVAKVMEVIAND